MRGDQFAGQQQAPGGGVDEQRRALAQVRLPVGAADLVADQRVTRGLVGNAQQRLGQAHQRHAFLRRQREFLDQALHQAFAAGADLLLAQPGGQRLGHLDGGFGLLLRQARLFQQHRHAIGLGAAVGGGDGGAQHRLWLDALREFQERLRRAVGGDQVGGVGTIGIGRTGGAGLVRQVPALDLLQVSEDGLLDQPVRRAVDGLGDTLEAIARGVVELDAESGGGHAGSSPKTGGAAGTAAPMPQAWTHDRPQPVSWRDLTPEKPQGAT
ncbi:hypothetical protein D9M72_478170 [compost metagenome]